MAKIKMKGTHNFSDVTITPKFEGQITLESYARCCGYKCQEIYP